MSPLTILLCSLKPVSVLQPYGCAQDKLIQYLRVVKPPVACWQYDKQIAALCSQKRIVTKSVTSFSAGTPKF
ncbi:MAG: hypothetical protein CVU01_01855 [Bacteroidetes bacterium HGW-Bacteroidetes-18]|nr:MAG: hypothetical protein CVU01_01855 [Bacteroidetes bacterium HGW-Bacteroidetes-18]